jgi:prevent-host-death family protein
MHDHDRVQAGPTVVPVSDLRRHAARYIDLATTGNAHVFVTQRGYVTAVLMARAEYETLARCRREREREVAARGSSPGSARPRDEQDWLALSFIQTGRADRDMLSRPFWTEYGWCDYESARTLAQQGMATELVCTEDGWLHDDEG